MEMLCDWHCCLHLENQAAATESPSQYPAEEPDEYSDTESTS